MARAFTAKAAKDYPSHGIKKGDTYYYWTPGFRGVKQMSLKPPRPSQLTTSKMSGALAAGEALEDALGTATSLEDVTSALETAIDEIRSVAEEYEEASQAETGNGNRVPNADEMEEKAQGLNDWADSLESDKDEIESMDFSEYADMEIDVSELDEDLIEEEEVACEDCDGSGHVGDEEEVECIECGGTGEIDDDEDPATGKRGKTDCANCNGTGMIEAEREDCPTCEGTGQVTKRVRKEVSEYDDLTDDEKQAALEAALEIANQNVGCPL